MTHAVRFHSGMTVGRYELLRPIGQGAMGSVHEAVHLSLGRRVAIKVMHPQASDDAGAQRAAERFLREGRAAAQVRHPHVVDVFDFGVHDGSPFLVMELVDGESLAQLLRRESKLTLERAVDIVLPILSAVAELHAAGIVHRDIKPRNILLARDGGCPKLADFGVSRFNDGSPAITQSGTMIGTPDYMAPELLTTKGPANERSDQYALGVTLYECVTGEKPFRGDTEYDLMHAVVTGDVPLPSSIDPSLTISFDEVVLRAMHRDAERRFASIDELAQSLLPFASASSRARWRSEFEPPHTPSTQASIDACVGCKLDLPRLRTVLIGRVFLGYWMHPPDIETVRVAVAEMPRARAIAGAPLVMCAYVPEGVQPPSREARQYILDTTPTILKSCASIHTVHAGAGVVAIAFRALARAMIVVGGYRGSVFIHDSLDDFLRGSHDELGVTPSLVVKELERMATENVPPAS